MERDGPQYLQKGILPLPQNSFGENRRLRFAHWIVLLRLRLLIVRVVSIHGVGFKIQQLLVIFLEIFVELWVFFGEFRKFD
jgi:hypothetical protein